jgi:hypothetical protein
LHRYHWLVLNGYDERGIEMTEQELRDENERLKADQKVLMELIAELIILLPFERQIAVMALLLDSRTE